MIYDFRNHSEECNLARANERLDYAVGPQSVLRDVTSGKVLVLDADKTLAAYDTGTMF